MKFKTHLDSRNSDTYHKHLSETTDLYWPIHIHYGNKVVSREPLGIHLPKFVQNYKYGLIKILK